MARFLILAFLALLAVAEIAAVLALVEWLGPLGATVVLALDMVVGLMVIRWAVRGPAKDRGFRLTAGAFIALPGLVLDLVGVALLIPAVRDWLRASLMRGTESALRRGGISVVTLTAPGDVIPGAVVVDETVVVDDTTTGRPSGPSRTSPSSGPGYGPGRTNPPVIRGEIVSGEPTDSRSGPPEPGAAER